MSRSPRLPQAPNSCSGLIEFLPVPSSPTFRELRISHLSHQARQSWLALHGRPLTRNQEECPEWVMDMREAILDKLRSMTVGIHGDYEEWMFEV
ncbi:hypothetical protein QJS10_CPB11g01981 [Acorus calamus]|uniref:Uncharacterized protein n=1 Tax=Acorus calamus TaxID=4465 RepID=A0AAV9DQA3_ACOCL|nr:hypothetical protein QJS10_CPB11g01981 [Acorus calamus]